MKKNVLLSFDIEEFDLPGEYGVTLPLEEQIQVSATGTKTILDILLAHQIKATFFSTVIFAMNAKDVVFRIKNEGHELASHGYAHSEFKNEHLSQSKAELEKLFGDRVMGFRMARMKPVNNEEIQKVGYLYNSSMNPVYLPGRYNNFFKSRTNFTENGVIQLPTSATPLIRFPLFWLSFHHLPAWLYNLACQVTINYDRYLNIYFHPWEFYDITNRKYGLPKFISKNSGIKMVHRFNAWIEWMKVKGFDFRTISEFVEAKSSNR